MISQNEANAASAFSRQSILFDELYAGNEIIRYKRRRVRDHVLRYLKPESSILELNSGTGEDAVFFADQGHRVHATDISAGMQDVLAQKVSRDQLTSKVSFEQCSFTCLHLLKNKGPYDMVFSNFAGLNCTDELDTVLQSLSPLLKSNGFVTLVLLPKFCLWETMLIFRGKFRTAFRRFFSGKGRKAHVEGVLFNCWYYNPSFITNRLRNSFEVLSIEGLCCIVPPSYLETFPVKYPVVYSFLRKMEDRLKTVWPWRVTGDYYIISLRKTG